jgi:hypothetical protein
MNNADPRKRCSFPGCGRQVRYAGLCTGHVTQRDRDPLRPLRPLLGPNGLIGEGPKKLLGVRVSDTCLAELDLDETSKSRTATAALVLEDWAVERRRKREAGR